MIQTEFIDGNFFPAPSEIIIVEKFIGKKLQPVITWNDLMPIVEKIEDLGYHMHTHKTPWDDYNCLFDIIKPEVKMVSIAKSINSRIEAVWLSVIEFIKYFNSQPLK